VVVAREAVGRRARNIRRSVSHERQAFSRRLGWRYAWRLLVAEGMPAVRDFCLAHKAACHVLLKHTRATRLST
jgi:hypothetical protein